ncbi:TadE family type IV pilus minor pilin [Microbacterium murale]|uniref:Flp pilus assembly protein TadG n=1 Tax=Microbacterium murale TaxID=1081040 RepID=A0ABU0P622_9MICO|nr:TadE family type IV pilus minor pilin [Microbacterium murale]MDQ0642417.1 Flp pilus assembly protein TadG [Microbacterium murale]
MSDEHLGKKKTDAERGSVAAELAIALPAVVLTLLLGAGALGAAARQVSLQDGVADAARLLGRGESTATAHAAVTTAVSGAQVSSETRGDLSCVSARMDAVIGRVIHIPLTASSCALSGGL